MWVCIWDTFDGKTDDGKMFNKDEALATSRIFWSKINVFFDL